MKDLKLNPQDHEYYIIVEGVEQGSSPTLSGKLCGQNFSSYLVTAKEARKIGEWFLRYAVFAKKCEDATFKE